LDSIWAYIAQDNQFYANKVLSKISESINLLLSFPFIWRNLDWKYRIIVEPNYKFKIVYRVEWDIIYIVSVFREQNSF
jgi:hypothetical protein